jgi:hypothetical protein
MQQYSKFQYRLERAHEKYSNRYIPEVSIEYGFFFAPMYPNHKYTDITYTLEKHVFRINLQNTLIP